jgi:hypothetical protein
MKTVIVTRTVQDVYSEVPDSVKNLDDLYAWLEQNKVGGNMIFPDSSGPVGEEKIKIMSHATIPESVTK